MDRRTHRGASEHEEAETEQDKESQREKGEVRKSVRSQYTIGTSKNSERQKEEEREENQTEGFKVAGVGCFRRSSAAKIVRWRGSAAFANVAASLTEKSSSRLTRYRDTFISLFLFPFHFFLPFAFW